MVDPYVIEDVLHSSSRLAVLRVLACAYGFRATGREIARRAGYSAPSTHEALKDLHDRGVVKREILGRQHVYSLNEENRLVRKVIRPIFQAEGGFKDDVRDFVLEKVSAFGIKQSLVSVFLYGSVQHGSAHRGSDVDVAVIVRRYRDLDRVSGIFHAEIAADFKAYFGVQLDAYVRSAQAFRLLRVKNRPPVSTLMRSYSVLYGKEPLEV